MKKRRRGSKILVFNIALALFSIIFISPGLLGFSPAAISPTKRMGFFIYAIAALIVFVAVNYWLLSDKKPAVKPVDKRELKAPKDYIKSLQDNSYKKEFEKQIVMLTGQVKRVPPKQASLDVILEQNFDKTELTYIKFKSVIDDVVNLFYENTKRAVSRISVFDENEYRKLLANQLTLPDDSRALKLEIFNEHMTYVDSIIEKNEEIITLLDNLILEIAKLDDISSQTMENIQIIAEMKELINNTKFYY